MKIIVGVLIFSVACTLCRMNNIVSLTALIVLVVLISQYIEIVKYKIEKAKRE